MRALNSPVVSAATPDEARLFQWGIVLGKKEYFRALRILVVPRFIGKTQITGKTAEIPERPKNNRET